MTHLFVTKNGVVEASRFVEAPALNPGNVWVNGHTDDGKPCWIEQLSKHGPESNPNHHSHELKIFGYDVKQFLSRQY